MEAVVESGRRFGVLSGCRHAFCLDCIRKWRGRLDLPKETLRACPMCREPSFYVVPCGAYAVACCLGAVALPCV